MISHPQARRDPEEEGVYMAFEELMAEAMSKKGKEDKKHKKEHRHEHAHETTT